MHPLAISDIRTAATIYQTILLTCRREPDKLALIGQEKGFQSFTYRQLESTITSVAGSLVKLGLQRRGRVGLLSENRPEWGAAYLAILAAGGTAVPLDATWKESELINTIRSSRTKFMFTTARWYPLLREYNRAAENPVEIIGLDDTITPNLSAMSLSHPYLDSETGKNDPAALIYTSGTTGEPKGVILTHRNIVANLEGIVSALEFYPYDRFLSVLPVHHTLETTCGLLTPLILGLTIVYARSLKSRDLLDDIANHKITCMIAVPLLFEKVHNSIKKKIGDVPLPKRMMLKLFYALSQVGWAAGIKAGAVIFRGLRKKAGLEAIRLFVSGGAPLPAEIAEWYNLVGFDFLEGYGLSECAPVVAVNRPHDIKFGSVGPALPNLQIAIDNPSSDGIGEIKVRGESITPGYIDNPAATDRLLRDGWLFTGDLGKIEKGHLHITGRKKNLIVSAAGKNIYPEEIELALSQSPYILEAMVLGRKRVNKMGEEVCAIVVPNLEQVKLHPDATEDGLANGFVQRLIQNEVVAVNSRLADYKRLSQVELRHEEFEKTSTRKIKRSLYK